MTPETKGRSKYPVLKDFRSQDVERHHAKAVVRPRLYAQQLSNFTRNGVFDVKYTCIVQHLFDKKIINIFQEEKRTQLHFPHKASFDQAAPPYQRALDECGYWYTLQYEPPTTNKRKNRQRNNILWYNPPFSKNVSTNIGHRFLALVDKHFPKDHKLRKIFNRNTIKISYSCMNNTKQIIDNHNKRILNSSKHINDTADNTNTKDSKTCNCRQKNTCLLNGNCLQSSLIYQATVTRKDNSTTETYIGLTENDSETRYRNHTASFRHGKHRNSTELRKYI